MPEINSYDFKVGEHQQYYSTLAGTGEATFYMSVMPNLVALDFNGDDSVYVEAGNGLGVIKITEADGYAYYAAGGTGGTVKIEYESESPTTGETSWSEVKDGYIHRNENHILTGNVRFTGSDPVAYGSPAEDTLERSGWTADLPSVGASQVVYGISEEIGDHVSRDDVFITYVQVNEFFEDGVNVRIGEDDGTVVSDATGASALLSPEALTLDENGEVRSGEDFLRLFGIHAIAAGETVAKHAFDALGAMLETGVEAGASLNKSILDATGFDTAGEVGETIGDFSKIAYRYLQENRGSIIEFANQTSDRMGAVWEALTKEDVPLSRAFEDSQTLKQERQQEVEKMKGWAKAMPIGVRGAIADLYADGIPAQELEAAGLMFDSMLSGGLTVASVDALGGVKLGMTWSSEVGGPVVLTGTVAKAIATDGGDRIEPFLT